SRVFQPGQHATTPSNPDRGRHGELYLRHLLAVLRRRLHSRVDACCDRYYKGEEDKTKRKSSATAEQEHHKKALRELNSKIFGASLLADDVVDDEVSDT
ncbi:hypothetical protein U1Q18_021527, partial [Sarracenia purpurea var. burkii]